MNVKAQYCTGQDIVIYTHGTQRNDEQFSLVLEYIRPDRRRNV